MRRHTKETRFAAIQSTNHGQILPPPYNEVENIPNYEIEPLHPVYPLDDA